MSNIMLDNSDYRAISGDGEGKLGLYVEGDQCIWRQGWQGVAETVFLPLF